MSPLTTRAWRLDHRFASLPEKPVGRRRAYEAGGEGDRVPRVAKCCGCEALMTVESPLETALPSRPGHPKLLVLAARQRAMAAYRQVGPSGA